jgi:hypothetical protein
VPRHTHVERAQQRRHKARTAKATKVERAAGRPAPPPPPQRRRPVELTSEQDGALRKLGLRHPESAAGWLLREQLDARPPERYRRRSTDARTTDS